MYKYKLATITRIYRPYGASYSCTHINDTPFFLIMQNV